MEEKMVMLDESDLDGIVGGAFNQKTIDRLGLNVVEGLGGRQGLYVDLQFSQGSRTPYQGNTSENGLRNAVAQHGDISVSVKTTSGEMRTLTKSELKELLP